MTTSDYLIFLLAVGTGAVAAVRVCPQNETMKPWPLGLSVLAGLGLTLTLVEVATVWLGQAGDPWNSARLTPAIALHHGFKLYYPLHEGPVLSTVVGPVAFLPYWPVGFVSGSPTTLILVASGLNLTAFSLLGTWMVRRLPGSGLAQLTAWCLGAQLVLLYPALRYSLFSIHADAPALWLCGLGLCLLLQEERLLSWRRCLGIALCLSLAVWAKQSVAPIFAAVLLLVSLRDGLRGAGRLAGAYLIVWTVVSLGFAGWFGFEVLRDNMLVVPSRHPWMQMSLANGEIYPQLAAVGLIARTKVLAAAALQILRANWPLFALLVYALLQNAGDLSAKCWRWPRTSWAGFFLIALAMLATAAVGRVKVGGAINHESYVVFFLVAAFVCWLAETGNTGGPPHRLRAGVVLAVLLLLNLPQALDYPGWTAAWRNQNEISYRYDRAHPGEVYFPWNPLSSLLAEGRLYHFDYGVFDRNLGGARVAPDHLERHLPAPHPVVASYIAHHDYILNTYYPGHVQLPANIELPGWRLFGTAARPADKK